MAFLKRLSRHKASKPAKEVAPDCHTFHYHNPVPVSSRSELSHLVEETELQDLVRQAADDVSLRFEIGCILFDHKVGVEDIVFELEESRFGGKIPVVRVVARTPVKPITWAFVSSYIMSPLWTRDLKMFWVDVVPAGER